MSGGSMGYLYLKIEEIAFDLGRSSDLRRRAFATHLDKVAKALHDIEWVDSGDKGPGDDVEAIEAVITPEEELSELKTTFSRYD